MDNRVWIELERPFPELSAEEQKQIGDARAEAANRILDRLVAPEDAAEAKNHRFMWSQEERRYCYGGPMGTRVLFDNGEWFNLDYMGRP